MNAVMMKKCMVLVALSCCVMVYMFIGSNEVSVTRTQMSDDLADDETVFNGGWDVSSAIRSIKQAIDDGRTMSDDYMKAHQGLVERPLPAEEQNMEEDEEDEEDDGSILDALRHIEKKALKQEAIVNHPHPNLGSPDDNRNILHKNQNTVSKNIWKEALHQTSQGQDDPPKISDLLEIKDVNMVDKTPIVVFFAYMRGGSSFMGSLLKHHPDFFYWYEPIWDIYSGMVASPFMTFPLHVILDEENQVRQLTEYEKKYTLKYLKYMFSCQFEKMPLEMISSWTLYKSGPSTDDYFSCLGGTQSLPFRLMNRCRKLLNATCVERVSTGLANNCHLFMQEAHTIAPEAAHNVYEDFPPVRSYQECTYPARHQILKCLPILKHKCHKAKLRAGKFIRTSMDFMEDMIREFPNMKVVHMLRDPRGTLMSRKKDHRQYMPHMPDEAKYLCEKMVHDIKVRKKLEKKYDNTFFEIRYEDLATDPFPMAQKVYDFLGQKFVPEVQEWLDKATNARRDNGAFGEARKNSTATAYAWKETLQPHKKAGIDEYCKKLYKIAGYDL